MLFKFENKCCALCNWFQNLIARWKLKFQRTTQKQTTMVFSVPFSIPTKFKPIRIGSAMDSCHCFTTATTFQHRQTDWSTNVGNIKYVRLEIKKFRQGGPHVQNQWNFIFQLLKRLQQTIHFNFFITTAKRLPVHLVRDVLSQKKNDMCFEPGLRWAQSKVRHIRQVEKNNQNRTSTHICKHKNANKSHDDTTLFFDCDSQCPVFMAHQLMIRKPLATSSSNDSTWRALKLQHRYGIKPNNVYEPNRPFWGTG